MGTKLVIFGDRFKIKNFQRSVNNKFADTLLEITTITAPYYASVMLAFDNLPANCPLLRLLVDAHCAGWSEELDTPEEKALWEKLPREFLRRVIVRFSEVRMGRASHKVIPADYYLEECEDRVAGPEESVAKKDG